MKKLILLGILAADALAINPQTYINAKTCNQIIVKSIYQSCYNYGYKGSTAVSYKVNGKLLESSVHVQERPSFYVESTLASKYQSRPADYQNSGYDQGHMANHADFNYDPKIVYLTYSLANVVPQNPEVNRHEWLAAETYERAMAKKYGSVNVINLIRYSSNPIRIGKDKIAVPESFIKIIYNDSAKFQKCFGYNNIPSPESRVNLTSHEIKCTF